MAQAQAQIYNAGGSTTCDYLAAATIASGDVVVLGSRVGIAPAAIANGSVGSVVFGGQHKYTLQGSLAVSKGDAVYWDDSNNYANKTSSGNTLIGYATQAAASNDAWVYVLAIN